MGKVIEDYFTELQTDMISICLEYVEDRAEKIYIYCSYENNMISGDFFYKINGKVVHNNKLNDAIADREKPYDVSIDRQKEVIDIIIEDIISLKKLCQEYQRDMPTQIKLIYDVSENKVQADYSYDIIFSNDKKKTSYDVLEEWYQLEKSNQSVSKSVEVLSLDFDENKSTWHMCTVIFIRAYSTKLLGAFFYPFYFWRI